MSHTDRHRPTWVQLADPFELGKRRWDSGLILMFRACQCRAWWCNSGTWRRPENRRRRHLEQRLARRVVKGFDWE